jgi:hypothetical protein
MQPTQNCNACDGTELLRASKIRRILVREMRPDLIVIRSVSLQHTAQVRFAEHDEVVE